MNILYRSGMLPVVAFLLFCCVSCVRPDQVVVHNAYFGTSVDLSLSASGEEVALVSNDGSIMIFRLREGIVSGSFPYEYPRRVDKFNYQRPAKVVLFANDNAHVLALSQEGSLNVYEKRTGEIVNVVKVPDGNITAMEYSRDRKHILVGTGWGSLYMLDAESYAVRKQFTLPGGANILSLAANNDFLLASTPDSAIHVLNIATGTVHKTLRGHKTNVYSLDIAADNRTVVSGAPRNYDKGHYGEAIFWNLETGAIVYRSHDDYRQVLRTRFSHDDQRVIVGFNDGIALHKTDGTIRDYVGGHFLDPETAFDMLPGQDSITAIGCDYGTGTDYINQINVTNATIIRTVFEPSSVLWNVQLSADNKKFIFVQTNFVKTIDLETDSIIYSRTLGMGGTAMFPHHRKWMVLPENNPRKATIDWQVVSTTDNTVLHTAQHLQVSPSLKYQAATISDRELNRYRLEVTGLRDSALVWTNRYETERSYDFPMFEFTSVDDILALSYDPNQYIRLQSLTDSVRTVTFAAKRLAYTDSTIILYQHNNYKGDDYRIVSFNLKTFTTEMEMPIQADRPEKAVVDKNKLYLWSGTTVVIYDLEKMMAIGKVDLHPEFMKREQDFIVSPNGKTFVIASRYGVIEFFDATTGKSKAVLYPRHSAGHDYIFINKDFEWSGTTLASENMMHLKSGKKILSPGDVKGRAAGRLLKALLVD